jgi:hypothetical protein
MNLAHRYAKQPTESIAQKLETMIKETTGKSLYLANNLETYKLGSSRGERGICVSPEASSLC